MIYNIMLCKLQAKIRPTYFTLVMIIHDLIILLGVRVYISYLTVNAFSCIKRKMRFCLFHILHFN